jgi:hypothetical protein
VDATYPRVRARHRDLNLEALRDLFETQRADVVVAGRSLGDEWDARLTSTMYVRNRSTAVDIANRVAAHFGGAVDPDGMDGWLTTNAEFGAARIHRAIRAGLAVPDADPEQLYDQLLADGVDMYAGSMVTSAGNFGAHEGAQAAGAERKVWRVNSGNPRSSHAGMGGQSVPVGSLFSNGMRWPGDYSGGADEVANCQCSLELF